MNDYVIRSVPGTNQADRTFDHDTANDAVSLPDHARMCGENGSRGKYSCAAEPSAFRRRIECGRNSRANL